MQEHKKIAVTGATGRVGRHTVEVLEAAGHDVVRISRSTGVDVVTGEGLSEALAGVDSIVDAASWPTSDQGPATEFFIAAARNLQELGHRAGVQRIVVVSIIGADRFTRATSRRRSPTRRRMLAGPIRVRILRAAQFHEFVPRSLEWGRQGDVIYVPQMRTQLVAARRRGGARRARHGPAPVAETSAAPIPEIAGPRRSGSSMSRGCSSPGAATRSGSRPSAIRTTPSRPSTQRAPCCPARTRSLPARRSSSGSTRRPDVDLGAPYRGVRTCRARTAAKGITLKYLFQNYPGRSAEEFARLSADEQQAILGEYLAIRESPGVLGGGQLQPVETATTVRVQDGETLLTRRSFIEAKEHLGGLPGRGRRSRRGPGDRRAHPGGADGRRDRGAAVGGA